MAAGPAFAQEEDLPPPKVQTVTAWNMSAKAGTMQISNTDLSIGDLSLERSNLPYPGKNKNRQQNNPEHGQFGFRMSSNFDIYVMPSVEPATKAFVAYDGNTYTLPLRYNDTVHIGNAGSGLYQQVGSTTNTLFYFLNGDAYSGSLGLTGSAYVYVDKDGNIYTFNPSVDAGGTIGGNTYSQRIDNIVFANGRAQKFYYDANKNLKLVTDSTGYAILFDIGSNGFVADACAIDLARTYVTTTSTCAGQALKTTYQYNATPQLSSFTDALGNTTAYTYGGLENSGDLICVQPPTSSGCKANLTVSATGALDETLADGSVWTINAPDDASWANYDWDNPVWFDLDSSSVVDPAGKTTAYTFSNSSPLTITDPNGRTTTYKWTGGASSEPSPNNPSQDGTMLTEVDYPEGNKYLASYSQTNFNAISQEIERAKPGSGLADRIVNYTYATSYTNQTRAKPVSRTDPKGNRTDWTYAGWGGMLTEMKAAPSVGAARPLKIYTYVQKPAYILNASGVLVSTGQAIWLPSTETICQTTAGSNPSPVCDAAAPQTVTTYQYGADGTADNLLLRGKVVTADGVSRRTCYGYDAYSHKISETTPRAGLSTCQ